MRVLVARLGLALALADAGTSQVYTITTAAGGALPGDVAATSASIGLVERVTADAAGNVYFAVPALNAVFRRDSAGLLTRIAGTGAYGYAGDGGPAVNSQLASPRGVGVDAAGNLYIADSNNHRIRRVSGGVITTVAGTGMAGFSGDGGPPTMAELSSPLGVAVDASGNVYVADSGNRRIRKISGGVITTVAGDGTSGDSGDGGPATSAQFRNPVDVAVDRAEAVYIADSMAARIRRISGGIITTVAGTGTRGYSGDGGPAAAAQLSNPYGVAVDSGGDVFIADSWDHRIRRVSGGVINTVAGDGHEGFTGDGGPATVARLNSPLGVAANGTDVYVADTANYRLRKVTGGVITTVAGNGTRGFGGDGGPASAAQLSLPSAAVTDAAGNLYVSDSGNHRIRRVSGGIITTLAGTGAGDFGGDGGPAEGAQVNNPQQIAIGPDGAVYIADAGNHRIRRISGGVIATVAGSGTAGFGGDGGPATAARLNQPMGVAIDAEGNVYIADSLNHRVRKVSGGNITTVAGSGQSGFSGDGGQATGARLNYPVSVAADRDGNLYIADYDNHRVRKVSGGLITTVAGSGVRGYGGDGGPAASAALDSPWGVAVDAGGNVYVAENGGHRIRKVSDGIITTVAGAGTRGFSGDGGPAQSAKLNRPAGLAFGPDGGLFLVDSENHRVRVLRRAGSAFATVSAASFAASSPLAPGAIAAGFGTDLVSTTEIAPAAGPLPPSLAGTSVVIRDSTGVERTAPLWFVSPAQINFYIAEETALGPAAAMVVRDSRIVASGELQINSVAPGLFTMNANGQGVPAALAVYARSTGTQDWRYVFNTGCVPGACQPAPLDLGAEGDQLFLELYGTGIRGRTGLPAVTATIGGLAAPVEYAGPVAGLVGLDQVNLRVPRALAGRGEVVVTVTVDGRTANTVRVNIR